MTTFTAYAALQAKEKFQLWQYEPTPLKDSEIEIRVTHNGLCHTDIHMRDNDWKISKFPLVAGHEVVGLVTEVGENVTNFQKGDRVGLGWIRNSCRVCYHCLQGEENICKQGYEGLIVGNHGGFADRVRSKADFACRIPDALDSASAAPLLCAGITVYAPLRTYIKYPGMKVGIVGIGGLGHLAIKFARAMGAEVIVLSSSADKATEAKEFGAHHFYKWESAEAKKDLTGSLDLLLITSSAELDWDLAFNLLANNGILCFLGIPASSINVPLIPLVFGQKSVVGSAVGGRRLMQEMLDFAAINQIKPMVQTMPISQINEAIDIVLAGKPRYRIVLVSEES